MSTGILLCLSVANIDDKLAFDRGRRCSSHDATICYWGRLLIRAQATR